MSKKIIYLDDVIDAVGSMLRRKFGIGGDLAEITLSELPSAQQKRTEERTKTYACDLIDRQAAIDAINKMKIYRPLDSDRYVISDCLDKIVNLPSVQPEIVRCKDCGHWDTTWQNDFAPNYHYCSLVDGTRRGDFFCADAERRGEQDE